MRTASSAFFDKLRGEAHQTLVLNNNAYPNLRKWMLKKDNECRILFNLLTGGKIAEAQLQHLADNGARFCKHGADGLSLNVSSAIQMKILNEFIPLVASRLTEMTLRFYSFNGLGSLKCNLVALESVSVKDDYCEFNMESVLKSSRKTLRGMNLEGTVLALDRANHLVMIMPPKLVRLRLSFRKWLPEETSCSVLEELKSTRVSDLCLRIPKDLNTPNCHRVSECLSRHAKYLNRLELEHENVQFAFELVKTIGHELDIFISNSPKSPLLKDQLHTLVAEYPFLVIHAHVLFREKILFYKHTPEKE